MILTGLLVILTVAARAQIAQGGSYKLDQSVIAGGGGASSDSSNNTYKIEGTSGQSAAGTLSSDAARYVIRSGFWSPNAFAPTAAGALIGGRVVTSDGRGITNAVLTLSGGTLFTPRTIRTGGFGYFAFEDVEIGQSYVLSIKSKRFSFPQNSQFIVLMDNATGIVFQALPEN